MIDWSKQMQHDNHPEDERYDEINIRIVERWKESEYSGDEWRFSYVADIKRKGEIIISLSVSRLDWLLSSLQWRMLTAGEDCISDMEAYARTLDKCDQPGCANLPTIFYRRLNRYSKSGGELAFSEYKTGKEYRQFCGKHTNRGDCDLDDAEHNYETISDPREVTNG